LKKILVILPFENIYPATNGGMLRCINILNQLAKYFDVSVVIHQDINSFSKSYNEFPALAHLKIYSSFGSAINQQSYLSKLKNALRYRIIRRSFKGPADGNLLRYYNSLKRALTSEKFDVVIPDTHSAIYCVPVIRRLNPCAKILFNAHNVELNLARSAFKVGRINKQKLLLADKTDRDLYKLMDSIICCSEEDKESFLKLNENKLPVYVIPNGTDIPDKLSNETVLKDSPKEIIFCGSLWSIPNAEGIHWFCVNVFPLIKSMIPDVKLLIVGAGKLPEKYSIENNDSILLIGSVDETKSWYNKAAVSIVPLLTGSGTRLKILEAMSLGVPVVSTSLGAEGICYMDNGNIIIADSPEKFANSVVKLLFNKSERIKLSEEGRKTAEEKYNWNIIGTYLKTIVEKDVSAC